MLRLFLFFPLLLLSQDLFTLPDEAAHFMDSYNKDLLDAKKDVYLFSQEINDYTLERTLKKLSKKKISIIIITQEERTPKNNKAYYLNLFEGVTLYTLPSNAQRVLKGSLTCIDNKKLYISSDSLDKLSLHNNYSFALRKKIPCNVIFDTLIQKSTKRQ